MKYLFLLLMTSFSFGAADHCENVKKIIQATDWSKTEVALIVENYIIEYPSDARIITQCAIAVAPDAMKEILEVMDRYSDLYVSTGSSKSSKSAKELMTIEVSSMSNDIMTRMQFPVIIPVTPLPIIVPEITKVDP